MEKTSQSLQIGSVFTPNELIEKMNISHSAIIDVQRLLAALQYLLLATANLFLFLEFAISIAADVDGSPFAATDSALLSTLFLFQIHLNDCAQ